MICSYLSRFFTIIAFATWQSTAGFCAPLNKTITIATSETPNLISQHPELSGPYNRFTAQLPGIKLIFIPPSRLELEFEKKYIDCLFPASTVGMPNRTELLESIPLQEIGAFVFSFNDNWKSQEQPVFAIRRGYDYGNVRGTIPARFVELSSDLETAKMLLSGRVEALIGYLPDVMSAFAHIGNKRPNYEQANPLYIQKDAVVCHKSGANAQFIETVNKQVMVWRTEQFDQSLGTPEYKN